jgi:hypothetical protein
MLVSLFAEFGDQLRDLGKDRSRCCDLSELEGNGSGVTPNVYVERPPNGEAAREPASLAGGRSAGSGRLERVVSDQAPASNAVA